MSALLNDLPADWEFATLGEINTLKAPMLNPKNFVDEAFEYYSIPDFQRDQRPSIVAGAKIGSSKLLLEPGTVLFGKLNPRVEKVWRVGNETAYRKIGSTEWITVFPGEGVDRDFLYFLEWSPHVMPIAKTLVSGSTPSRQRVDPKSFYRIRVPLPPLPEQKKIAHILSTVQRTIEAQNRIIQTTTELFKAMLHQLMTAQIRVSDKRNVEGDSKEDRGMKDSGNSWQSRPLGDLAITTSGGTPSRKRKDYYGGLIPWVKSGELNDDYISETKEHITEAGLKNSSAKIFQCGTVLIALYGATVGKTSILRMDASTNQAVCGITPGPNLDAGYLRYHLIFIRRELLSRRYGGAQPNISQQIVRNQKIAYPPLPEQKKIAHTLLAVQKKIDMAKTKKMKLEDLFRTLLHELMTARTRVNNSELKT